MELRPTTRDDLPALHDVFLRAIASVYEPHGFPAPATPLAVFANNELHVLETGSSVLAGEDGAVLGFGSSWTRGDDWFLASLFVAPEAHGRRLGTALLDAVWGSASRRRTLTDAIQPVSNALYARRGLVPTTPLLTLAGEAVGAAPVLEPGDGELAAIDEAAYGFDRAVDHAHWGRHGTRVVWQRDGAAVAYSYAFPGGTIGPVAGLDAYAAAAALESALAAATGSVRVRLPGSARALVEVAVRCGLRLTSTPGLLLLSATAPAPAALAISGYTLF